MTFQMESYTTLTTFHAVSIEYFKDISFSLAHFPTLWAMVSLASYCFDLWGKYFTYFKNRSVKP